MEFERLQPEGLILITPQAFEDERGFFMESYSERAFAEHGISVRFVQDNHSKSTKGVLRGLHFQRPPHAQCKLVRVTRGVALDVAVDLRTGSPTYRQWAAIRLSEENQKMLYIPAGFAHGFLALADLVEVEYKVDDFYDAASDGGVRWDDPDIGIDWGIADPLMSEKDRSLPFLKDLGDVFAYGA